MAIMADGIPSELTKRDQKLVCALADCVKPTLENYYRGRARDNCRRRIEQALLDLGLAHLIRRDPREVEA